jgi:3-hydroxyacyl-[acyl-carrier-protein] dehydratase
MNEAATTRESADIADILRVLPHRYPFLLLDRLTRMQGDESAVGIKNITANEPQFQGHFPGNPVFPGVLIIEGLAQTAGALYLLSHPQSAGTRTIYLLTIDKAKFRKPVTPGDTIEYHIKRTAHKKQIMWFRGEAKVGGQLVAEAEVGLMLR